MPTATMPGPVRAFAEHQPVTSIVNTIRDLLARQPAGTGIWTALAWCAGILAVAYVFANISYRRRIGLPAGTARRQFLPAAQVRAYTLT